MVMTDVDCKIKEWAMDDHEMYCEIKIKGRKSDVKKVLEAYIG